MSAISDDPHAFVTRGEFDRAQEASRARFDKLEARQDKYDAQQAEHAREIKTLKDLITDGFRELRVDFKDVRSGLEALKSVRGMFVTGLGVGAGIAFGVYQAIHATFGVHP